MDRTGLEFHFVFAKTRTVHTVILTTFISSEREDRASDNSNDGEWGPDEVDLNAVTIGNMSIDSKPVATDGERGRYREITVDSGAGESLVNPDDWQEPPPLAKRSLEQETEMTGATIEQQGESKRRMEHPEVPQAADSSSSSESATDTEVGLVDACSILCGNSERATGKPGAVAEGREGGNSERATGKPVVVAEERNGGLVTLDLTKWDFNKADCRTRCRKLIENSNPLLLVGSPIDSDGENEEQTRAVLHLAFICELYEIQGHEFFFSHTFALSQELGPANSCGFHQQVPRHIPDSD